MRSNDGTFFKCHLFLYGVSFLLVLKMVAVDFPLVILEEKISAGTRARHFLHNNPLWSSRAEPVSETWDNLGFTPKFLDTNRPKREQKVAAKHILQSITQPLKWSFWLSLNIP